MKVEFRDRFTEFGISLEWWIRIDYVLKNDDEILLTLLIPYLRGALIDGPVVADCYVP